MGTLPIYALGGLVPYPDEETQDIVLERSVTPPARPLRLPRGPFEERVRAFCSYTDHLEPDRITVFATGIVWVKFHDHNQRIFFDQRGWTWSLDEVDAHKPEPLADTEIMVIELSHNSLETALDICRKFFQPTDPHKWWWLDSPRDLFI